MFTIKPSHSLTALLQRGSKSLQSDTAETALELRDRRRLSEKIAMVYIGMFVTIGDGFSAESIRSRALRKDPQQMNVPQDGDNGFAERQGTAVDPHLVMGFAQRLVENRYEHFEFDPLLVDDAAAGAGESNRDNDEAEERAWNWCPSGLPEPGWANAVEENHGRTRLQHLWMLAAEAVQLVRKLPPDTQELIAGNYVEESAWLILSMAWPAQGRHGSVRRLVYLLSECL